MISEFRKSINSILFERMSSPFYGAFISSWIAWNWKIIYLTIFISESKIEESKIIKSKIISESEIIKSKIDFIVENYSNTEDLIIYPILSTLVVLLILPFLTNGAYWTSLKFKNWRKVQTNNIEKKQLLTLEQSIAIRKELKEKEFEYEEILQKREKEIADLNQVITDLENTNSEKLKLSKKESESKTLSPEYKNLKANKIAFEYFEESYKSIEKEDFFPKNVPELAQEYYLINQVFVKSYDPKYDNYIYKTTDNGKNLYKEYFNEKHSSKDETEDFV